jgi:hypothetical protein
VRPGALLDDHVRATSARATVDARVAPDADGRLTWSGFRALLDGVVAAADLETTAAREQKAAEQQLARPARPSEDGADPGADHGCGPLHQGPVATVVVLDASLQRIADILRELDADADVDADVDRRRVKALLILARPDLAAELIVA